MDFQAQLDDVQNQLVDAYENAVEYFDGLGVYGLTGWGLVVFGSILLLVGLILFLV